MSRMSKNKLTKISDHDIFDNEKDEISKPSQAPQLGLENPLEGPTTVLQ